MINMKIDKYEYFTVEEILPCHQSQIIEQAKFTNSPLGKTFEKQTKTPEDQGEKQRKAFEDHALQTLELNDQELRIKSFNDLKSRTKYLEQSKEIQ